MPRHAALAVLFAACGGSADNLRDAPPGDGSRVDAATDAPVVDAPTDAPPAPPFSGTISVLETDVLAPGLAMTTGQGPRIRIAFLHGIMLPAPVLQSTTGGLECTAWEYSVGEAAHAALGLDEGPVTMQLGGGALPVPTCAFRPGQGYTCQDATTMDTGGSIAPGTADTATFTDNGTTFTSANSLGRYLRISGANHAANDGLFPIVAVNGPSSITYVNAARVAEVLPGSATHVNVAGAGAIPSTADPGFLGNELAVTVNHVAGGGNHVPAFTLTTSPPGHLGDDFTLDAASMALITHIPRDGNPMMFTCETGCDATAAERSEIELVTTDAPVTGLPPLAMPPPVTRQVRVRCSGPATNPILVPAAFAARLMTSGATRVQATYTRASTALWPDPPVTLVAGHALVAVTTF